MFRRYDNSKRAIALLGALLALLPGAQQAGLLCELGGCTAPSVEHAGSDGCCTVTTACSHSHMCQTTSAAPAPGQQGVDETDSSSPCPTDCWCHQTPQPLDLRKDSSQPFELLLRCEVVCHISTIETDHRETSAPGKAQAIGGTTESVVHRCAELCRFLI